MAEITFPTWLDQPDHWVISGDQLALPVPSATAADLFIAALVDAELWPNHHTSDTTCIKVARP